MPKPMNEDRTYELRVRRTRKFLQRLVKFIVVISMLSLVSFVLGLDFPWILWIAFFWGISIALEAANIVLGDGTKIARTIVNRIDNLGGRPIETASVEPSTNAMVSDQSAPGKTEMQPVLTAANTAADEMRRYVRQLPPGDARGKLQSIVSRVDSILLALEEQPGEVLLARDFLNGLLLPINRLVISYSKLAGRDIEAARDTLRTVEENDLPQLISRLDGVYERLQRGNLIDLEVAREMMRLDSPFDPGHVARA